MSKRSRYFGRALQCQTRFANATRTGQADKGNLIPHQQRFQERQFVPAADEWRTRPGERRDVAGSTGVRIDMRRPICRRCFGWGFVLHLLPDLLQFCGSGTTTYSHII
jgi:hypothetical protein